MHRILLVEDSRTQAHATSKVLEKNGYEVIVAEDGQKGMDYAKERTPDLVIMDIVMPEANGFEATRKINTASDTHHIPIVMLSSKDQLTDKLWALRQGAMGYLVKPVQERELVDTVSHLLNQ